MNLWLGMGVTFLRSSLRPRCRIDAAAARLQALMALDRMTAPGPAD